MPYMRYNQHNCQVALPAAFSFRIGVPGAVSGQNPSHGISFRGYFIDIGVPEDYAKAELDFADD
jgi:NDP-sugar pyrophosphorylase family protein